MPWSSRETRPGEKNLRVSKPTGYGSADVFADTANNDRRGALHRQRPPTADVFSSLLAGIRTVDSLRVAQKKSEPCHAP